nr:hypothetical protein HK105_006304 [Polyrhizophydium stewartii]
MQPFTEAPTAFDVIASQRKSTFTDDGSQYAAYPQMYVAPTGIQQMPPPQPQYAYDYRYSSGTQGRVPQPDMMVLQQHPPPPQMMYPPQGYDPRILDPQGQAYASQMYSQSQFYDPAQFDEQSYFAQMPAPTTAESDYDDDGAGPGVWSQDMALPDDDDFRDDPAQQPASYAFRGTSPADVSTS